MKIEVINDGNPDAIHHVRTCKKVSAVQIMKSYTYLSSGGIKQKDRYCAVTGWLDQAEYGMVHDVFGQVEVHPGCNVIVRTGKGCCLKKYEYRIDSEQDVLAFNNEVSLLLGLEKV